MNTFTRKSLAVALAGASILYVAAPAQAVSVSAKGTGQVLLYPYYTVRGAVGKEFTTLISVVNATAAVKAVKVRFLEGKNSAGVFDFNLYLSPNDVWVGAIVPTADGAKLITHDRSCTDPAIGVEQGGRSDSAVDFVNYAYASDPAGGSVDRVREGWFEILEMGVVGNALVANAATHVADVPHNCALVRGDDGTGMQAPTGGLFGSETLINVQLGTDYTADPVALDNWRNVPLWTAPGSPTPDLADALPQRSTVLTTIAGEEQAIVTGGQSWGGTNSVDPVSAVLMHESIMNEFVLDTFTASGTDWVVTFPTKRFYYVPIDNTVQQVTALFQRNFTSSGAADDTGALAFGIYDREEQHWYFCIEQLCSFPMPPLLWAANTMTFNSSNVLSSINRTNVSTIGFQDGWMRVHFPIVVGTDPGSSNTVIKNNHQLTSSAVNTVVFTPSAGTTVTNSSATYLGLPSIGFAVTSYSNNGLAFTPPVLSNYGGNWVHKYTDHIQTP